MRKKFLTVLILAILLAFGLTQAALAEVRIAANAVLA